MILRGNMFVWRLRSIANTINNYNKKCIQINQCSALCTNINEKRINNISTHVYTKLNSNSSHVVWRNFSSEPLPKDKNVFGDLSSYKYQKVDMDANEEAEERFTENEQKLPLRVKKTAGKYTDIILSHLKKGDLLSATSVLDLIKSNRDKPTTYMFKLLMHSYAVNGDMENCFKLFKRMKDYGLQPNDKIYTNLLHSIAYHENTEKALARLYYLRKMFLEKQVVLNDIHYNAIIFAYGRHLKVKEAFALADEMRDKKLPITLPTFNALMACAISQKEGGLKLVLLVWHMIKSLKIKPDILTYNLLLRSIRDNTLGDLKINDFLWKHKNEGVKIQYSMFGRPNLLRNDPVVTEMAISIYETENRKNNKDVVTKHEANINLPSVENNENLQSNEISINLNDIHKINKLILFGGMENILNLMELDEVQPNVKTLTYLMELSPNSVAIEDMIIDKAKQLQIQLDVTFFNILMRKRCYRHEYDSARKVLNNMETFNLFPDVVTWGTLALTCDTPAEIKTFMDTMENVGFQPDSIIIGILMVKASRSKKKEKFETLIDLMKYTMFHKIKPSKLTIEKMDAFGRQVKHLMKEKDVTVRSKLFKEAFMKYTGIYEKWRCKAEPKKVIHES